MVSVCVHGTGVSVLRQKRVNTASAAAAVICPRQRWLSTLAQGDAKDTSSAEQKIYRKNAKVMVNENSFKLSPRFKQGLYNTALEKDSCGVGLVANLKGKQSHDVVKSSIEMVERMKHRGGCGCEANTGDGAGILVAMPDGFMRKTALNSLGLELPDEGQYASGLVFTSTNLELAAKAQRILERALERYGLKTLGWHKVPTNNSELGFAARLSEPNIEQVFVTNPSGFDKDKFELQLMRARKTASAECNAQGLSDFYVCSLSCRTLTIKGQLTPTQLGSYYVNLRDEDFHSHLALCHSRFSTNTFPSWDRAQPNRMLCHNGEINTLRGNKNWMATRSGVMRSPLLAEDDQQGLLPMTSDEMTDSGNVDLALELLVRGSGRTVHEAMMMMIPEAWQNDSSISPTKRAYYEFHSNLMEPWDGPSMVAFSDGRYVGACLDRNGLRPSRYYVTKDDTVILSSEVGVLPNLDPGNIAFKGRLQPGKMFLVDFDTQRIVHDEELKESIATAHDYQAMLDQNARSLESWVDFCAKKNEVKSIVQPTHADMRRRLNAFGYTTETMDFLITPMALTGKEALGSMGVDTPLAVLSTFPRMPNEYFKQLFAQITNPPIDPIRESIVMSLTCPVGPEGNLLANVSSEHVKRLVVENPILSESQMDAIKSSTPTTVRFRDQWCSSVLDASFAKTEDPGIGLKAGLEKLCQQAEEAVTNGDAPTIVISHENVGEDRLPIPSLLACGAVHQHLIKKHLRTQTSLFLDVGDVKEVHDFATSFGFGADAVCPRVAYEALRDLNQSGFLKAANNGTPISNETAEANYRKAVGLGMLKVMSKMGISTLHSYKGAQIFEAVGLRDEVIDMCFTGTSSRVEGAGFEALGNDVLKMHAAGFPPLSGNERSYTNARSHAPLLRNPGDYHYRHGGEAHYNDPASMVEMQYATRFEDKDAWKRYHEMSVNDNKKMSFRGLLSFKVNPAEKIPIDEVEPASEIVKRFVTGAMSLGSISAEAHEALATAMNRLGGRSNTGEGGEDPLRFKPLPNGDSKRSAIKQVASGRFGVTAEYLANSDQIQIKMAQGAKPGEGGELPGFKVSTEIAGVRGTTPGVGLISPPPHHDIYSIEDLFQLIYDLKRANLSGSVSVKLVSEVGVGIVASGAAKSKADHIVISGGDGGTGAAAWTGIHRAGIPWELGLAEAQQTLVVNNLRSRIRLQVDGQLKNGRDVAIAALLGAEEFGFSTAPLVAMGCIMMRKCHLNTCPVGIATQDPELREKFRGQPEHVVNFFFMLAEDVRNYMAELGFRNINDMIGRVDKIEVNDDLLHYKSKGLDLSPLLQSSHELNPDAIPYHTQSQDHELGEELDFALLTRCTSSIEGSPEKVFIEADVNNFHRAIGSILSNAIVKKHGAKGLPDGTIHVKLRGSAGQSFGFVLAKGVTMELEGDANDGVGKSLSGGRIVVYPDRRTLNDQKFCAEENVVIGNVACYGATSGEAYFRGLAGERFCVRNSGAKVVVEGVGDHGCEYMTGGRAVILGETGRNFAAGMSGGIAWIWDPESNFKARCNTEMVGLECVEDAEEVEELRSLIENHRRLTASSRAKHILENWDSCLPQFVKVYPHDYRRVIESMEDEKRAIAAGASG